MQWFVYAFICAILIGIVQILNKKILSHEHATEFSASRGVIMMFMTLFLIPFIDLSLPWNVYFLIYLVALISASGMIFFFKSVRHGEVSTVAPLMNISPFFLLIIAFFILGERPEQLQYIGVGLLIFGAYSLEVGVRNKGFMEPIRVFMSSKVIHYLMFAMIIFSISATLDKLIISQYTDSMTYMFIFTIFLSLNFIILETYKFGFKEIMLNLKKDFKLLFLDGLFVFLANIFYFLALAVPGAAVSLIIPIKRTSTLFTTLFGGKLFHEDKLMVKVLACIIMIWGAVFILL